MQIDNGMLAELQPHSPVVLRIYRWSCPTLSLGHFQEEEGIPFEERWANAPRVRRKTGGGAILHDLEWTYSLVIPSRPEIGLKGHSEAIYRATHRSIVDGLREMGWEAKLSEQCTCSVAAARKVSEVEPFLCFMRRSPVDVLIGQDKILGSAQRRSAAGLLQHGSFLLSASALTPSLHGLFDQSRNSSGAIGLKSEVAGERAETDWVRALGPSDANSIVDFAWRFWGEWLAERLMAGIDQVIACKWDDA